MRGSICERVLSSCLAYVAIGASSHHGAYLRYRRPVAFNSVANVTRDMTSVSGVLTNGTAP